MADGKVKKYFKNLRKMKEEGVNVPVPKKKAVVGKTNYGINWNKKTKVQKTRPTGRGTGKGINIKKPGEGQGGVGLTTLPTGTEQTTKTKQGEKPKKKDYLTGIKQPPLEAKHDGEVNLDNVEKVQTNVVEDYDKQARAYGKPPTKKMEDATERIDKFGHKLDTAHELPRKRGGKKKYSYSLKTPAPEAEKKKKKKKLTEAVNVLSGNQVFQGVIEGTGEYIGTKYSNRLFGVGEKTEKKTKKNNKKKGR
jgi:hypothetical protein